MRILVVEDDAQIRFLLEFLLGKWGHEVLSAADGAEAFCLYQTGEVEVVITDWMMPNIDGLELCRKIRSDTKVRPCYIYIILVTAQSGRENLIKGMEAGADDYITKPLDKTELQIRLNVAERIVKIQKKVTKLEGLLPICSYCKKIRHEKNLWEEIEDYITTHSFADFSHSICPDCYDTHILPHIDKEKK